VNSTLAVIKRHRPRAAPG